MIDKFKKEVGFIRNSSSKKKIMRFSPSPSQSSDSFSSFEYDPRKERHEQFSPYKHPIAQDESFRPRSNPKPKEEKHKIIGNQPLNSPPKFSNQVLRNNFIREVNENVKQNHVERKQKRDIASVSQQKHRQGATSNQNLDNIPQENNNDNFEQELSLSNIHKFQKSKISQKEEPVQPPQDKNARELPRYKNYIQQSPSSSDEQVEVEKLQKKQTVKQPRKVQRQAEREEELITEYDKRQFKDKSIKRAILQQHNKKSMKGKGAYETKGGICFELDTRQFKGNANAINFPKKKKKKSEADERLLLIQRRQMAKLYDRQARGRVFGYY